MCSYRLTAYLFWKIKPFSIKLLFNELRLCVAERWKCSDSYEEYTEHSHLPKIHWCINIVMPNAKIIFNSQLKLKLKMRTRVKLRQKERIILVWKDLLKSLPTPIYSMILFNLAESMKERILFNSVRLRLLAICLILFVIDRRILVYTDSLFFNWPIC